jgi:hypothetical protein
MSERPQTATPRNGLDESRAPDPSARWEKNQSTSGGSKDFRPANPRGDPRVLHSPPARPGGRCGGCGAVLAALAAGERARVYCDDCSDGHGQWSGRDRRKVRRRCSSCSRIVLAEACTRRPSCDRCRALPRSCSECPTVLEGGQRIVCSSTCGERRKRRLGPEVERERQRRKRAHRRARRMAEGS